MTKEEYNQNPNKCLFCGKDIICDKKHKLSYILQRHYCNRECYLNHCKTIHNKIGIYAIKNKINNKIYIGQSNDIENRWRCHRSHLRRGVHQNQHLQGAWNKYGEDNFDFFILELCEIYNIDELERCYIEKYNSMNSEYGYNYESGGNLNKRVSEQTREKISKNHADVSRENNPFYNKKHSKESIQKFMKNPNYINRRHKGTDSHTCTITEDVARKIKEHFADGHKLYRGEISDIAKKYNTNINIVSHIKNGHAWAWL